MATTTQNGESARGVDSRSAFRAMLVSEWKLLRREPVSMIWGFLIPVLAVTIVGALPHTRTSMDYYQGQSVLQHYIPIIVLVSLAMLGLNGLPPVLAAYRERGVLRRLFVTPVKPSWLLAATGLVHLAVAVVAAAAILLVPWIFYGVSLPGQALAWVLTFVLSAGAALGIGVLVASAAPSAKVANGVGGALFFPLMFLAGLWVPVTELPTWLRRISDYSPFGASDRALISAAAGHWPAVSVVLVLLGYGIALPVLAVRSFRWD